MEQRESGTEQQSMNRDTLAGQWKQMRGSLKSWWGKLTDDDFDKIAGHKDRLIGTLQEKYGYARDMAQREVDRRLKEYDQKTPGSSQGYTQGATSGSETMESMGQKVRDTAYNATQSASQMASDMKTKAQEMGSMASEKAGSAVTSVGGSMSSLAGVIRENAPTTGTVGSAASAVADQLDAAGSYLQEQNFADVTKDLTALVRRYPLQSLLAGLGIGYLMARSSRR